MKQNEDIKRAKVLNVVSLEITENYNCDINLPSLHPKVFPFCCLANSILQVFWQKNFLATILEGNNPNKEILAQLPKIGALQQEYKVDQTNHHYIPQKFPEIVICSS